MKSLVCMVISANDKCVALGGKCRVHRSHTAVFGFDRWCFHVSIRTARLSAAGGKTQKSKDVKIFWEYVLTSCIWLESMSCHWEIRTFRSSGSCTCCAGAGPSFGKCPQRLHLTCLFALQESRSIWKRSRCFCQYTRLCVPYLSEVQETYRAAARAVTRMASGPLSILRMSPNTA